MYCILLYCIIICCTHVCLLFTLGAHARGLLYLVCVSVPLVFCHLATMHATRYTSGFSGTRAVLEKAFSLKMLRSGVTATFGHAAKSAIFCCSHFPVPCTCTVLTIATIVPQIFNYVFMNIILATCRVES